MNNWGLLLAKHVYIFYDRQKKNTSYIYYYGYSSYVYNNRW